MKLIIKRFLTTVLCVSVFMISGCQKKSDEQIGTTNNSKSEMKATTTSNQLEGSETISESPQVAAVKNVLDKESNKQPDDLITTTYPENEIISFFKYQEAENFNTMLDYAETKFPVECIRKPTGALTYTVYNTQEKGRMYVFYHGNELLFADYLFYAKELLYRSDFEKLKLGDSLADVEAIDSGMAVINAVNRDYLITKRSLHLYKGGICRIQYQSEDYDPDHYRIASIDYFNNGSQIDGNIFLVLDCDYLR